jgi:uncharacterized protein
MKDIWEAADDGDLDEVEWLLGQEPGLLDRLGRHLRGTPLMRACDGGHVEVARFLLDKGAAINAQDKFGRSALLMAVRASRGLPVVKLLVERGADLTTSSNVGYTPLVTALGRIEIVRFLLALPSVKATIDHRTYRGRTALWKACNGGRVGVVRTLLQSGADPRIADDEGITPMAIAKSQQSLYGPRAIYIPAKGRLECVAALKVSLRLPSSIAPAVSLGLLRPGVLGILAGGGAGLPAMEGTAGGRPAGEGRGDGGGRAGGGEEGE